LNRYEDSEPASDEGEEDDEDAEEEVVAAEDDEEDEKEEEGMQTKPLLLFWDTSSKLTMVITKPLPPRSERLGRLRAQKSPQIKSAKTRTRMKRMRKVALGLGTKMKALKKTTRRMMLRQMRTKTMSLKPLPTPAALQQRQRRMWVVQCPRRQALRKWKTTRTKARYDVKQTVVFATSRSVSRSHWLWTTASGHQDTIRS
jgi:hypothetical protein